MKDGGRLLEELPPEPVAAAPEIEREHTPAHPEERHRTRRPRGMRRVMALHRAYGNGAVAHAARMRGLAGIVAPPRVPAIRPEPHPQPPPLHVEVPPPHIAEKSLASAAPVAPEKPAPPQPPAPGRPAEPEKSAEHEKSAAKPTVHHAAETSKEAPAPQIAAGAALGKERAALPHDAEKAAAAGHKTPEPKPAPAKPEAKAATALAGHAGAPEGTSAEPAAAPPSAAGGGGGPAVAASGGDTDSAPETAEAEATEDRMAAAENQEAPAGEPATESADTAEAADAAAQAAPAGEGAEAPSSGESQAAPEEEAEAEAPGEESAAPSGDAAELPSGQRDAAMASVAEPVPAPAGAEPAGGSAAAIPDQRPPEVPDVSHVDPEAGMAEITNLPPAQMQQALGGVASGASHSVTKQRADLAAHPPTMARPSGSPATQDSPAAEREAPLAAGKSKKVEKLPAAPAAQVPELEPPPPPLPPPTQSVPEPRDAAGLGAAVSELPTEDEALNETAGPPPPVPLEGDSDPARVAEQRQVLHREISTAHEQGRADQAQPMGESGIYPHVPRETLRGQIPAAAAAPAPPAVGEMPAAASPEDEAANVVAQEQSGGQIRSAAAQARVEIAAKRREHGQRAGEEREKAQQDIRELEAANRGEQQSTRTEAQREVHGLRGEWNQGQQDLMTHAGADATKAVREANTGVSREQVKGEAEATRHIREGNAKAAAARADAERDAAKERKKGEEESSGVLGWLADKAKAAFNAIKNAIKWVFEKARKLVRAAIDLAKKLAVAAIELARKAIVAVIHLAGEALIAIGDYVLRDFPALRDRFRKAIRARVAQAEKAVNAMAERLKRDVQRALDLLGKALDAALGLLEKAYLAAVDAVGRVVQGAINAAKAIVQAVLGFVSLIKDVASGPWQWIKNLGAGIVDGIRNHLWRAFKEAVQKWFSEKVEEVLGLGTALWNLLTKGGLKLADIAHMAWEAIKEAIPPTLIRILVEKLVSMLVPAAGAIMAIIEGLQAAWGTIKRILAAFERFFKFLKAVKSGNAGRPFADAVAAAAIAVIDFVANWLLKKLRGPASKIAGKLRAIGRRIMAGVKKAAVKVGGAFKKLGAKIKGGFQKLTARFRRKPGAPKPKKEKKAKTPKQKQTDEQRLEKAVTAIQPKVDSILASGASPLYLKLRLLGWKLWYRLSELSLSSDGEIEAAINPRKKVAKAKTLSPEELGEILLDVFAKAEDEYAKSALKDVGEEEFESLSKKWQKGQDLGTEELSRFQQMMLLRKPIEGGRRVEAGVSVVSQEAGHLGRMTVAMGPGLYSYQDILSHLSASGEQLGVRQKDIVSLLSGRRDTLDQKLARLQTVLKGTAKGQEHFFATMRRTAVLTQALEPARRPGVGVATAMSFSLGSAGRARMDELLSPEGRLAPMTPEGAASKQATAKARKAKGLGASRTHAIFTRLLHVTKSQKILVGKSFNSGPLARKLQRFLDAHVKGAAPDELARKEALFIARIVELLKSYHG